MSRIADNLDKKILNTGLLNIAFNYELPYDLVKEQYLNRKRNLTVASDGYYHGRESHIVYNAYKGTLNACKQVFLERFR